jgi:hypothetical protein
LIKVICTVPEGLISVAEIKAIQKAIDNEYQCTTGVKEKLLFVWFTIPLGLGFDAGSRLKTMSCLVPVANGCISNNRFLLMRRIHNACLSHTSLGADSIKIIVPDANFFKNYLGKLNLRYRRGTRVWRTLLLLVRLVRGRITKGYFTCCINT